MSVCPDCITAPTKVCTAHHLAADNLADDGFELVVMLRRSRVALADKHESGHPEQCGTCAALLLEIDRLLERVNGGVT